MVPGSSDREAGRQRILHLIDTAGPGGAETVFRDLVTHLPAERWESRVVIPWDDDWLAEALREEGIEPVVLGTQHPFDLGYLNRAHRLVREFRPDVVQTHLFTTSVYMGALASFTGHPVVSTFHGSADAPLGRRFRRLKFHLMGRRRSRFVFVSESLRRWFLTHSPLREDRTRVVHNGVAPRARSERQRAEERRSWRARLGVDDDVLLVGSVGNVRRSKDYPTLLRAARKIVDEAGGSVAFVIAGDGGGVLREELDVLHGELGLGDSLRFLDFVSDVGSLLSAVDVYALSSSSEGFSLATVEAASRGLPVVATRCGGPEEIIEHGRTGLLVPVGNPDELARSLLRLAMNPELRSLLASEARTTVARRFSIESMVHGYESTYRELLGEIAPETRG